MNTQFPGHMSYPRSWNSSFHGSSALDHPIIVAPKDQHGFGGINLDFCKDDGNHLPTSLDIILNVHA